MKIVIKNSNIVFSDALPRIELEFYKYGYIQTNGYVNDLQAPYSIYKLKNWVVGDVINVKCTYWEVNMSGYAFLVEYDSEDSFNIPNAIRIVTGAEMGENPVDKNLTIGDASTKTILVYVSSEMMKNNLTIKRVQ